MIYYEWVKALPLTLFIFTLSIIGINYTVDPLQQFRISSFYPIYFSLRQQRYLNPGLAKNYDYESLILGTSHANNFSLPEIEKELSFKKAIKFTIAGASAYEERRLLQLAIRHKSPKNIFYGLDVLAFAGNPVRKHSSFPEYLYEESIVDSLIYLLKFDTTKRSFQAIIKPYTEKNTLKFRFDYMYEDHYAENDKFAKALMLNHPNAISQDKKIYSFKIFKQSFDENILNIIRSTPEVNYTIFYPPYSILAYQKMNERGILEDVLKFKKYIYKSLNPLPNVVLYDFQIAKEVTHNLNNYKDYTHYHRDIASWVLKQVKENHYLVDKKNIAQYSKKLLRQVKTYDLEK